MATGIVLQFPGDESSRARILTESVTGTASGQRRLPETSTATSLVFDTKEPVGVGGIVDYGDGLIARKLRLSQDDLYPARSAYRREHITAIRLLKVAIGRAKNALEEFAAKDSLTADTEIHKLQVLLPELFCCRSLGDGFGTIVNALMSAFETLDGDIPNVEQIRAIHEVLLVLKEKPFLTPDEADEQLKSFELVGLSVYPSELLELLSSD